MIVQFPGYPTSSHHLFLLVATAVHSRQGDYCIFACPFVCLYVRHAITHLCVGDAAKATQLIYFYFFHSKIISNR